MVTREQVLRLIDAGLDYDAAASRLGIGPGLAYMIATGLPADGGDTLTADEQRRPGFLPGSTQHLANDAEPADPRRDERVISWIKQRVAADPQMRAAAATRNAEPGPPEGEDEDHDIASVITRDHNRVTALVQQLSAIPGHKKGGSAAQIQRRESIVDLIATSLSKHESAEEELFWPAVRKHVPDGDGLAERGAQQEQAATETLTALARSDADSDEFDDLVEQLVLRLRKHTSFEEQVLLAFRDAVPKDQRAKLGRKFRSAESHPSTRARSPAPRKSGAAAKPAGAKRKDDKEEES
jgi:hypothetical protein